MVRVSPCLERSLRISMSDYHQTILTLIRLGLKGDSLSVRQLGRRILRDTAQDEHPDFRSELASLLVGKHQEKRGGTHTTTISESSNSVGSLVRDPTVPKDEAPVLSVDELSVLHSVISEQKSVEKLLDAGVEPTRSLLLTGPPGVGKTHTASYLAGELDLPLITVDLSNIISSYLGRTGENVRRVLDHARDRACLLFLDEFDALAKRRDDQSDVGELKRIVNVLLLELDDWLPHGLLVAATNHPDLLDPAVWRRFDRVLEISKPTMALREQILESYLQDNDLESEDLVEALAAITEGATGSDLEKLVRNAVRSSILDDDAELGQTLIEESVGLEAENSDGRRARIRFAQVAHDRLGKSHRAIGRILGVSHVTVGRWLRKDES